MSKGSDLFLPAFVLSVVLFALGGGALWFTGDEEEVREVRVVGNEYLDTREVLALAGWTSEMSPMTPMKQELLRSRLLLHPAVLDVDFLHPADGVFEMVVEERKCAAIVSMGGQVYDIDAELQVLDSRRSRCLGVWIVEGRFELRGNRFEDVRLKRLVEDWLLLRSTHPELAARISEVRIRPGEGLVLFAQNEHLRVEMPKELRGGLLRLYGTIAYMEEMGFRRGLLDLRGEEALFITEP